MNSENRRRSSGGRGDWRFTFVGGSCGAAGHHDKHRSHSSLESASWRRLSNTAVGETLEVIDHYNGPEFISSLTKLGVSVGSVIKVVSRTPSGSIIVGVDGKQIGFGWSAADQIYVVTPSCSPQVLSSASSHGDIHQQF